SPRASSSSGSTARLESSGIEPDRAQPLEFRRSALRTIRMSPISRAGEDRKARILGETRGAPAQTAEQKVRAFARSDAFGEFAVRTEAHPPFIAAIFSAAHSLFRRPFRARRLQKHSGLLACQSRTHPFVRTFPAASNRTRYVNDAGRSGRTFANRRSRIS